MTGLRRGRDRKWKDGNMSYVTAFSCRATDVATFASEAAGHGKEVAMNAGATDVRVMQTVMGGDRAGMINVLFDVPSINAAMDVSAAVNADSKVMDVLKSCGVEMIGRSLMRVAAQRGTTDGTYGTLLMMTGNQIDDARSDSNIGDIWAYLSDVAHGMRLMQAHSAGVAMAPWAIATWTDDLDALAAASATGLQDPKVQANMADANIMMIGRSTSRSLA